MSALEVSLVRVSLVVDEAASDLCIALETGNVQRCLEQFVTSVDLCAFQDQVLNQLGVALVHSDVQTVLLVRGIHITQYLVLVLLVLAEELGDSSSVTELTKVEKCSDFTEALRRHCRLCLPLIVEVALIEAFNHFKLVTDHPVLPCVLFEIE